jgi:hypothetical protein
LLLSAIPKTGEDNWCESLIVDNMKDSNKIRLLALACVCSNTHALSTGAMILKQSRRSPKVYLHSAMSEEQTPSEISSTYSSTRRKNTRLQMAITTMAEPKQQQQQRKKKTKNHNKVTADNDTSDRIQKAGAEALRSEMMNHEILTRDQDLECGLKVQRANSLKESMMRLIDDKEAERLFSNQRYPPDLYEEPINESLFFASGSILDDNALPAWSDYSSFEPTQVDYDEPSPFDEEYDEEELTSFVEIMYKIVVNSPYPYWIHLTTPCLLRMTLSTVLTSLEDATS